VSGTIRIEKLGKPGVFLAAEGFEHDAKRATVDNGMTPLRIVVVPGYVWGQPTNQKPPLADANINKIIDALTRPLTAGEVKPKPIAKEMLKPIQITADSYEAAVEKFNQLFLDNHWGDGLSLVPPTKKAVDWMLTGTSLPFNKVIGKVDPKGGSATVEKIAINAVMAGAKPEYLPVIIAAMEGFTDPNFDLRHPVLSMGSFSFAIVVSGPIVEELNINSGAGFFGHGWRANATIGRALRLCMINLGHTFPQVNDMARLGRQSAYTFYVMGENKKSPWPPYQTTQGYKPEDSCVTVSTVGSHNTGAGRNIPHNGNTADSALETVVETILSRRSIQWVGYKRGTANLVAIPLKYLFLVTPEMADLFSRRGFKDQKSLKDYIYEATSVPYEKLSAEEKRGIKDWIDTSIAGEGIMGLRLPPDRISFFQEAFKPGGKVPLITTPEDIHIMVVGYGAGGGVLGGVHELSFGRPLYKPTSHQTRPIKGATLTKAGREKAKPSY
jgi:hypothetical protein